MKLDVQMGSAKIWFGLLRLAIQQDLPINEKFYKTWGTKQELASLKTHTWWRLRGKEMFESAVPRVSVVEADDDAVTVRIPTSLNAVQVKRQVSAVMTKHRGAKRLKKRSPMSFVGDVNYKRLKQYERYLGIEFDPQNAGKTIEEKTELFRDAYRRIEARMRKQRETLAKAGVRYVKRKALMHRFRARDPDAFDMFRDVNGKLRKVSEVELRKGINAKKVSRWKLSGKILLLNVAEGQFPGKGYYGNRLAERLRVRLAKVGLKDIGVIAGNKGGGRTKAELTLVQTSKTKAQWEAESLRLYGGTKGTKPVNVPDV